MHMHKGIVVLFFPWQSEIIKTYEFFKMWKISVEENLATLWSKMKANESNSFPATIILNCNRNLLETTSSHGMKKNVKGARYYKTAFLYHGNDSTTPLAIFDSVLS